MNDIFYRSDDPTSSVKALKEWLVIQTSLSNHAHLTMLQ